MSEPVAESVESRVVVFTREGCHLCEQAIVVIAEVCRETGATYRTVDIDSEPQLQQQYNDQVPVTFVDGRQHDFWRVDPQRLRTALG